MPTVAQLGPSAPDSVLQQIQKLLNLANKNDNPNEAASAASKAQALMEEWNLTVAAVEDASLSDGKREDAKVGVGFYKWQRWLWRSVAELNFCLYFLTEIWDPDKLSARRDWNGHVIKGVYVKRHRLVGRVVNVQTTRYMAQYLEKAIEDAVNERTRGLNTQRFSNWAVSFRTGAAAHLVERLEARRRERVKEAAETLKKAGHSTSTALTIKDVEDRELEANQDFLYGEGFTANRAAQRAAAAEECRLEQEARTRWAAEHPEEAAAEEAARREEYEKWHKRYARSSRARYRSAPVDNIDYSAFNSGHDHASKISLDPQVGDAPVAGRLAAGRSFG